MIINTIFYNVKLCVKLSGATLPDLYSYMGTNITEQGNKHLCSNL